MNDRGQTAQDYVIGISILLLTLTGVFAFVPSVFGVAEEPVERNDQTQAAKLSDVVLAEYGANGTATTLDYDRLSAEVDGNDVPSTLLNESGIRRLQANITVRNKSTDPVIIQSGPRVETNDPTATVVRFVRFENTTRCNEGICQMVVRVW